MKKIENLAAQDAERWLAAEMAYGEGAGTRRKLIGAEVETKMWNMPGYTDAFNMAYDMLDKNKFAQMAIKERKSLDRAATHGKNLRALRSGNFAGLTNGLFLAVGTGYVLHMTGYDKVLLDEGKKVYRKAKTEVRYRKARWQGRNVTKIV